MKKRAYILIMLFTLYVGAYAQEVRTQTYDDEGEEYLNGMVAVAPYSGEEPSVKDSLHLPDVDYTGMVYSPRWGYSYMGGSGPWRIHEGLNASVDLSAFTSFGKNHISGTAERIDLLYARALSDRWSIAVGGYFTNMNTNRGHYMAGGLSALVDYRFNEHWEAYVFAQKNLFRKMSGSGYGPWYGMDAYDYFGNMCDRIGLGVRYNFNPSTYVEVQFSWDKYPSLQRPVVAPTNRSVEENHPHPSSEGRR